MTQEHSSAPGPEGARESNPLRPTGGTPELSSDGKTRLYDGSWTKNSKDSTLRKSFGLRLDQYLDILTYQHGGCGICGCPPQAGRALDVDVDHNTREIRGLLCSRCRRKRHSIRDPRVIEYLTNPPARGLGPFHLNDRRMEIRAHVRDKERARVQRRSRTRQTVTLRGTMADESYVDTIAEAIRKSGEG